MKITHRELNSGRYQTIIELRWNAVAGDYVIEVSGYGTSPEEAEKAARLLLGQARSKLNEVTSLPATLTESAT